MTLLQAATKTLPEQIAQWDSESVLLAKLQEMVPIMPRDQDLSRLEIINYVIDYIRQLREMVVLEQVM